MPRITGIVDNVFYVSERSIVHGVSGYYGETVNKLAKFEDFCEDLQKSQNELSNQMGELRQEGKEHTVKFKELMVKKLTNINIISLFRAKGLL